MRSASVATRIGLINKYDIVYTLPVKLSNMLFKSWKVVTPTPESVFPLQLQVFAFRIMGLTVAAILAVPCISHA